MNDDKRTLNLPDNPQEVSQEEIKPLLDDLSIFLEKYAPNYGVPELSNAFCNALKYVFVNAPKEGKINMLHNLGNFFDHLVSIAGVEIVPKVDHPETKH